MERGNGQELALADEGGLRRELRAAWSAEKFGELVWVEHARGGSVGAPDVFVPLGEQHGYCPLELKWWECVEGVIQFSARPAQKRFHILAAGAGQRTAYLGKLSTGGYVLLPGVRLHMGLMKYYVRRLPLVAVRATLLDETFWEGRSDD